MVDPLSMTLAAVALATALKDTIEVAQKLKETFQKPTQNLRVAQSLAAEVLDMVQDINAFYKRNEVILRNELEIQYAVMTLLDQMKLIYEKCDSILQRHGSSQKIGFSITVWRNRKVLENNIRTLKYQANACLSRFWTFTQLRTMAGILEVKSAMRELGFVDQTRKQFSAPGLDESVRAFMGSNLTILSTLPRQVKLSPDLVYKSYLQLQVLKINSILKNLALNHLYPTDQPDSSLLCSFPFVGAQETSTPKDVETAQEEAIALVFTVQKHLEFKYHQPSLQQGALAMCSLSAKLSELQMPQEAVATGVWAVNLYRTLCKAHPSIYIFHLIQALYNLSVYFVGSNDLENAYETVGECVTLSRHQESLCLTLKAQFQTAKILYQSAYIGRLNGAVTDGLRDAEESVEKFQHLLGKPATFLKLYARSSEVRPGISDNTATYKNTITYHYACALQELHHNQFDDGKLETEAEKSVASALGALELLCSLTPRYIDHNLHCHIAGLYLSLCNEKFYNTIKSTQLLHYAEEASRNYEKAHEMTGSIATLLRVFNAKVLMLRISGNFDEAYALCQKIIELIPAIVDDQRLSAESLKNLSVNLFYMKRYNEAVIIEEGVLTTCRLSLSPPEVLQTYYNISAIYNHTGDHFKAIEAAEATIAHIRLHHSQYQQTASHWLAVSLRKLVHVLYCAKEYERALIKNAEALMLYKRLVKDDPNTLQLQEYKGALEMNIEIYEVANTMSKPLNKNYDIIEYCRELVDLFPNEGNFYVYLIRRCAYIFDIILDRPSDSSSIIQQCLAWFEHHPVQDATSAELQILCLQLAARFLHTEGHSDRAYSVYKKASKIGKPFSSDLYVARAILRSKTNRALMSHIVGRESLAVAEIEECFRFAYKHKLEKETAYTWCLNVSCLIYRSTAWRLDEALEIIQKSVTVDKHHGRLAFSWILSDILADIGRDSEALRVAEQAVEAAAIKAATSTYHGQLFREAQYSLALRLFVNGNLPEARGMMTGIRRFYQWHAQSRNMWLINLAITLRAEGIVECASNRHEEGIIARTKLNELQKRLRLIFPSFAELLDLALNRERNYASWKNIIQKFNVTCGHQQDEPSSNDK